MKHIASVVLGFLLIGLPAFAQSAQSLVIPDVIDGGGWQSTIVLTNSSTAAATVSLIFHSDTSNGNTQLWTPAFLETSSTTGLALISGSSMFLHTPGTAALLTQGWAEVHADAGILAFSVYTYRLAGQQDQDSTSPAVNATNRLLVPYDDANGFKSGIAIVNPTAVPQSVSVGFQTTDGLIAMDALPTVPAMGHMTFVLSDQFPEIKGHRGLAEFYSATGNLSMSAFRFNPTHSSVSMPVFFQTGAPLITAPPVTDPYMPGGYQAIRPSSTVQ